MRRLIPLACLTVIACSEPTTESSNDPCINVTCSNQGTCVVLEQRPTCACNENYMPDGINGLSCVPLGTGGISGGGGEMGLGGRPQSGGEMAAGGSMRGGAMGAGGAMGLGGLPQSGGAMVEADASAPMNLCQGITCNAHGQCVVLDDRPTCACDDGYAPDPVNGLNCVPFVPGMWRDAGPMPIPDGAPPPVFDAARPEMGFQPSMDAEVDDWGGAPDAAPTGDSGLTPDAAEIDAQPPSQDADLDAQSPDPRDADPNGPLDAEWPVPDADLDAEPDAELDAELDAAPAPPVMVDRCDAPHCVGDDRAEDPEDGIVCLEGRLPFWPSVGTTGIEGRMERRSDEPGEPVVVDHYAGLTWMGCPVGVSGQHCSNGQPVTAMGTQHAAICQQAAWGGHDDWQAPNGLMVETLMSRQRTAQGVFDERLFPYPAEHRLVRLEQYNSRGNLSAWSNYVRTLEGRMYITDRARPEDMFQVYCVRPTDGGQLPSEVRRCFQHSPADQADPTLEDLGTGLVWTSCLAGLRGPACDEGQNGGGGHRQSVSFCEDYEYAGHDDWMMPTVDQLNTLADNVLNGDGSRRSGFTTGLLDIQQGVWAVDRVGANGYSSFYFLDVGSPITFETQIERNGANILCVREGAWAQTLEYPRLTCSEIVPFRVDAHWDGDDPRLAHVPGGPESPGQPTVHDALNGLDWTGCVAGLTGDECDVGEQQNIPQSDDAARYCARLEWGGFDDWRLPAFREYASLIDFESLQTPPLAAGVADLLPSLAGDDRRTFHLQDGAHFAPSNVARQEDGRSAGPVYCVRDRLDGPPATEIQCLETNAWHAQEPTVTDALNGLQWSACPLGYNGRGCATGGGRTRMSQLQGNDACAALNWAGREDWRLPSMAEGARLIDFARQLGLINIEAFPIGGRFWTLNMRAEDRAWVLWDTPTVMHINGDLPVRCVRDL